MSNLRRALVAAVASTALVITGCSNAEDTADPEGAAPNAADDTAANAADDAAEESTGDSITIEDNYGEKTIERPIERVVALDNRTFEVLDQWGVKLDAAARSLVPETIPGIKDDESIIDVGNHKEPDLEAIVAVDPQLILSGQRFTQYDEQLEEDNPDATLVELEPRKDDEGRFEAFDKDLIRQVETLGEVFEKEDEAKKIVDDFNAALDRAREAYDGNSTVMAVNVSGGKIGYVAPGIGRLYGPLFDLLDLKPALEHVDNESSDHEGDDISVEAIAESNPDIIIALDRDAAVTEDDFVPAEDVIKGAAPLQNVTALLEDNIYIAPGDTYTNESIITYTEILNGLADQFEQAAK